MGEHVVVDDEGPEPISRGPRAADEAAIGWRGRGRRAVVTVRDVVGPDVTSRVTTVGSVLARQGHRSVGRIVGAASGRVMAWRTPTQFPMPPSSPPDTSPVTEPIPVVGRPSEQTADVGTACGRRAATAVALVGFLVCVLGIVGLEMPVIEAAGGAVEAGRRRDRRRRPSCGVPPSTTQQSPSPQVPRTRSSAVVA